MLAKIADVILHIFLSLVAPIKILSHGGAQGPPFQPDYMGKIDLMKKKTCLLDACLMNTKIRKTILDFVIIFKELWGTFHHPAKICQKMCPFHAPPPSSPALPHLMSFIT